MSSKTLPERPSLAQLKLQAKELLDLHRERRQAAAARIAAHHPRFAHMDPRSVLDAPLKLADAQVVVAREYGFQSWGALKHYVEIGSRVAKLEPHPRFADALTALVAGDIARLTAVLNEHPELVRARTNLEPPYGYFSAATLLHHVAWNPSRKAPVPSNIVDIARLLVDRGADVNAMTLGRSGGTTIGLVITSRMASEANVSGPLIDLLLARGATLDLGTSESVIPDWGAMNVLDAPLANHAPRAAEKLIELGARADICAAAALGRMDLLRASFDAEGRLRAPSVHHGRVLSQRDAIGLALLFAYVNRKPEAVDFLLEHDGNWDMTGVNNGTAMHRAAWSGDLSMVKRLVAKGADVSNRDNPFNSTPLSWAQHNAQREVFDWMRANCRIDLHEAVGHNLREHAEARVREDPSSVNKRLDHWEAPQCTPLYWAAWTEIQDNDGQHAFDETDKLYLVRLLLDHGADPNIVAGDGYAPLDVARTAGASRIVALLQERGAKSASELQG
jgi:ankyrin repeat protein